MLGDTSSYCEDNYLLKNFLSSFEHQHDSKFELEVQEDVCVVV